MQIFTVFCELTPILLKALPQPNTAWFFIKINFSRVLICEIHIFYLPWMFIKFTRSTMQFPIPVLWIAGVTVIGMRPSCHPTSSSLTPLLWKHTCSAHNLHKRAVLTFKSTPWEWNSHRIVYIFWYYCDFFLSDKQDY